MPKFFLLLPNIVTLDFPFWCLVWNNCSLAVFYECWMHIGFSWNYESFWKRTDLLCTRFLSWCCSGFNLKDFLLNFALNGIERANIAGQIQQTCLPETSRRHGWCCDTNWKLGTVHHASRSTSAYLAGRTQQGSGSDPAVLLPTSEDSCSATWSLLLHLWRGSGCSVLWATLHCQDQTHYHWDLGCPFNTWLEEVTLCSLCCVTC